MVSGLAAGRHHGPPHPQFPGAHLGAGDGRAAPHAAALRGVAGQLSGRDHPQRGRHELAACRSEAWFERKGDGVDAPPLVGGHLVTLALEHVPEVGVAAGAARLGALHAHRPVLDQHDRVVGGRLVEAGPAAVRLELRVRPEQLGAAGPAAVHALGLGVGVLARPRRLGPRLAQHPVLLRAELLPPLCFGLGDLVHAGETTREYAVPPPQNETSYPASGPGAARSSTCSTRPAARTSPAAPASRAR